MPGWTARHTAVCFATANRSHFRPLSWGFFAGFGERDGADAAGGGVAEQQLAGGQGELGGRAGVGVSWRALTV